MEEKQSADVAKLMDLEYKRAASASAAILFIVICFIHKAPSFTVSIQFALADTHT